MRKTDHENEFNHASAVLYCTANLQCSADYGTGRVVQKSNFLHHICLLEDRSGMSKMFQIWVYNIGDNRGAIRTWNE